MPVSSLSVYFVTGAAGFVGRHVCRQLRERGDDVRAVVRRADPELTRLGVRVWVGDLWHDEILREAIGNADVVIHCAGDPRFGNGPHYHRTNVELTERLLHTAQHHAPGLRRFVFVSTIGAIDRAKDDPCAAPLTEDSPAFPSSDYGRSKLEAERVVRDSGLAFTIIRPALVVGDDMREDSHFAVFAKQALSGALVARIAWPGAFSVVHVDDLADALLTAATHPNATGQTLFCASDVMPLSDFFDQCQPGVWRMPLSAVAARARRHVRWIPFSLKALLFPALTASDERLRALGWHPRHSARSALAPVIARERARLDPDVSPGGQTVVTGAASGLGRALVRHLASRRERLLLIDKDGARLATLAGLLDNCATRVVDLSDEKQVDALLVSPEWNACHITELYACAGIGLRGRMQDVPVENHRRMFAVNVLARIALTKSAIDVMRIRHFGRVVLISSSSAFQPLPYMATYAATNAALLSLGESWGAETADEGVHLMTVCPGGMNTDFQKSGGVKEVEGERLMLPEDVAAVIIKGLRQKKTTLIVSFRSFAMSVLARLLPRRASVVLWSRLMEKLR
jgi:nucleoside-diphosphate-sugar epimerase